MSGERPLPRLEFELGTQLGRLFDGQPLVAGIDRELGLVWELYKSRTQGLRSQCIRSFSIIGDPWL